MYAEFFELVPWALLVVVGLFGLIVGSFLNVVAYRLPIMMEREWRRQCEELASEPSTVPAHAHDKQFDLWQPRSACPACGAQVTARDNIPLLSYLLLRGRCRNCGAAISVRYPMIEAAAAVIAIMVAWVFGPTWQMLAAVGVSWTLLALSVIDIDRFLLPDSLTLPLMWCGFLASALWLGDTPLFVDLHSSVIGAVGGYLSLWFVYQLFKWLTGKEGMGHGDFKLLAALGAWLGWQMLPLVIVMSASAGALIGGAQMIARRRSRQTPIPFGPYLAAAGWIALLWGDRLNDWYFATFFL
jgi:leader peptidase (prepilin peptidase)/N-methyltransferase